MNSEQKINEQQHNQKKWLTKKRENHDQQYGNDPNMTTIGIWPNNSTAVDLKGATKEMKRYWRKEGQLRIEVICYIYWTDPTTDSSCHNKNDYRLSGNIICYWNTLVLKEQRKPSTWCITDHQWTNKQQRTLGNVGRIQNIVAD